MHKTIEAVEVEGLANFAGNEGDAAMDRTIIAAHDIFGIALTGIPGHQAGTGIHCIVAVFAPTPLAIFAFRFISLQIISFHCSVANFACNECNDATKGYSENEYFATLPRARR